MYLPKASEPGIRDLGGEPLQESGFESEEPVTGFELDELVEEGFLP